MTTANQVARVLHGALDRPRTYDEHLELYGPAPASGHLISQVIASGLTGRGGAAFPTGRKLELLRAQRSGAAFVVVNAMEGEPAAHKDRTLLAKNPHLVLDGAVAIANALDADRVIVCTAREHESTIAHLTRAIAERPTRSRRSPTIELHTPPGRYVAGEESALVHWLNDHETLPQYRPTKPHILRIGRSPVLVDNAETHAHVALIARYGADWFKSVGTSTRPGTMIVSLTGAVPSPRVLEVACGTPLRTILNAVGADAPAAFLLGGYGGTWVSGTAIDTGFDDESLRPFGGTTGPGIVVALPHAACGVAETARIVAFMARESARQCGPCAFGLPAMADDLALLVAGRDAGDALARLTSRASVIEGRGACRHPDGVVRLVRSALSVFARDVAAHADGRPCAFAQTSRVAHVPRAVAQEELEWQ
jgi:NADH:ubiquinone oxidoreductase subunit F (NADH-binding)